MKQYKLLILCCLFATSSSWAQSRIDRLEIGASELARGKTNSAIEEFRASAEFNPFDPIPLNNLAVALAQRGDYLSAVEHFERAIRLNPNIAAIRINLDNLRQYMHYRWVRELPEEDRERYNVMLPEPPPLWNRR